MLTFCKFSPDEEKIRSTVLPLISQVENPVLLDVFCHEITKQRIELAVSERFKYLLSATRVDYYGKDKTTSEV